MDRFKQYVEDHRSEFESSDQDFQELWVGIDEHLDRKTSGGRTVWLKAAAVLLVIAVSTGLILFNQLSPEMPQELVETEQHYNRLISVKLAAVTNYRNEVDAMIWNDLELLDQAYQDLKHDLDDSFDQEEVAQAMIDNQRAKLEILEDILNEIESKVDEEEVKSLDL